MTATGALLNRTMSSSMPRPPITVDVLVIGAGQAGLAAGYHLRSAGLRYELFERHARIGDSWRARFDSLTLFTPRSYSALPSLALGGNPAGFPTKDEIADYLESYAEHFSLPVRLNAEVLSLEQNDDRFRATVAGGSVVDARAVIIASGAFQTPAIPRLASGFSADVWQLTPDTYRNPTTVPLGTVLVVGDGATGRHIARELAVTHRVLLAGGRSRRLTPDRILGRNTFWWLDRLGLLKASRDSRIGRWLRSRDPFPSGGLDLRHLGAAGVQLTARLTQADGVKAGFADGSTREVDSVVWATGYRDDTSWVRIPGITDETGKFAESRGVSPVVGVSFVGRSWQSTRGSALLLGVGDYARFVVGQIVRRLGDQSQPAFTKAIRADEPFPIGSAPV
jgi:putative flavoprotein involved in K+ transport